MSDIPIEILNAIRNDINDVLKKHLENYSGNILPSIRNSLLETIRHSS